MPLALVVRGVHGALVLGCVQTPVQCELWIWSNSVQELIKSRRKNHTQKNFVMCSELRVKGFQRPANLL
jgi:hypothetical protein